MGVVGSVREALLRHAGGRLTDDVALLMLSNDRVRVAGAGVAGQAGRTGAGGGGPGRVAGPGWGGRSAVARRFTPGVKRRSLRSTDGVVLSTRP